MTIYHTHQYLRRIQRSFSHSSSGNTGEISLLATNMKRVPRKVGTSSIKYIHETNMSSRRNFTACCRGDSSPPRDWRWVKFYHTHTYLWRIQTSFPHIAETGEISIVVTSIVRGSRKVGTTTKKWGSKLCDMVPLYGTEETGGPQKVEEASPDAVMLLKMNCGPFVSGLLLYCARCSGLDLFLPLAEKINIIYY